MILIYRIKTEGWLLLLICYLNFQPPAPSILIPANPSSLIMTVVFEYNRRMSDVSPGHNIFGLEGGYSYGRRSLSTESSFDSQDERRSYESDPDAPHRSSTPSTSSDSENSQYLEDGRRPSPPPTRDTRGTLTFRASSPPQRRQ